MKKNVLLITALCFLGAQTGFASPPKQVYDESEFEDTVPEIKDPLEKINRKIFTFNKGMDVMVFQPVDKIYRFTTPLHFRTMVHNFMNNLKEPVNFINGLLQLNPKKVSNSMGRFILNSTWGLGGVSDVAGYAGMIYKEESFGKSTLSRYKIKPGPYIVLPLLGPSSARDAIGIAADIGMDPLAYALKKDANRARLGVEVLDAKDQTLDMVSDIERISLDDYAAIRSLYMQKYR